jgi:hypothetical protein
MGRSPTSTRRGVAAVVMVVLLLALNLIIIGMVLGGARDQDLTVRRLETVRAFYAAEAGANMAVREVMVGRDEDGDGRTGTISDDDDSGNDPAFGQARVRVTMSADAGQTTLTSKGRAGQAARRLEVTLAGSSDPTDASGLLASYFIDDGWPSRLDDIDWAAAPDATGIVSQLNWPQTSDATPFWIGGPYMDYGAEFAGKILIDHNGAWRFYTESDDGSKLWIDGIEVVNNDGLHSMRQREGRITLTAGLHDITVRFFEHSGVHGLIVSWRGLGRRDKEIIPAEAFSH